MKQILLILTLIYLNYFQLENSSGSSVWVLENLGVETVVLGDADPHTICALYSS